MLVSQQHVPSCKEAASIWGCFGRVERSFALRGLLLRVPPEAVDPGWQEGRAKPQSQLQSKPTYSPASHSSTIPHMYGFYANPRVSKVPCLRNPLEPNIKYGSTKAPSGNLRRNERCRCASRTPGSTWAPQLPAVAWEFVEGDGKCLATHAAGLQNNLLFLLGMCKDKGTSLLVFPWLSPPTDPKKGKLVHQPEAMQEMMDQMAWGQEVWLGSKARNNRFPFGFPGPKRRMLG